MPRRVSEIGYWSEIKLDIIREYAGAYSRILAKQPLLRHVYIDGFSGSGQHTAKRTGTTVLGSPTSVLQVTPPFKEYHFIDLDKGNIDELREQVRTGRPGSYDPSTVHFYNADCNQVLLTDVFPRSRFEDYVRALCLLDPWGLDLNWEVLQTAGQMKSIDIFLNFPIMDINRNALWRNPEGPSKEQLKRLTAYWGDESWRDAAYSTEGDLFGFEEKTTNEAVVAAFRRRLKDVAGFANVPEPIPMRNTRGAVVYYLFFASQKEVAEKIARQIFVKYKNRKG